MEPGLSREITTGTTSTKDENVAPRHRKKKSALPVPVQRIARRQILGALQTKQNKEPRQTTKPTVAAKGPTGTRSESCVQPAKKQMSSSTSSSRLKGVAANPTLQSGGLIRSQSSAFNRQTPQRTPKSAAAVSKKTNPAAVGRGLAKEKDQVCEMSLVEQQKHSGIHFQSDKSSLNSILSDIGIKTKASGTVSEMYMPRRTTEGVGKTAFPFTPQRMRNSAYCREPRMSLTDSCKQYTKFLRQERGIKEEEDSASPALSKTPTSLRSQHTVAFTQSPLVRGMKSQRTPGSVYPKYSHRALLTPATPEQLATRIQRPEVTTPVTPGDKGGDAANSTLKGGQHQGGDQINTTPRMHLGGFGRVLKSGTKTGGGASSAQLTPARRVPVQNGYYTGPKNQLPLSNQPRSSVKKQLRWADILSTCSPDLPARHASPQHAKKGSDSSCGAGPSSSSESGVVTAPGHPPPDRTETSSAAATLAPPGSNSGHDHGRRALLFTQDPQTLSSPLSQPPPPPPPAPPVSVATGHALARDLPLPLPSSSSSSSTRGATGGGGGNGGGGRGESSSSSSSSLSHDNKACWRGKKQQRGGVCGEACGTTTATTTVIGVGGANTEGGASCCDCRGRPLRPHTGLSGVVQEGQQAASVVPLPSSAAAPDFDFDFGSSLSLDEISLRRCESDVNSNSAKTSQYSQSDVTLGVARPSSSSLKSQLGYRPVSQKQLSPSAWGQRRRQRDGRDSSASLLLVLAEGRDSDREVAARLAARAILSDSSGGYGGAKRDHHDPSSAGLTYDARRDTTSGGLTYSAKRDPHDPSSSGLTYGARCDTTTGGLTVHAASRASSSYSSVSRSGVPAPLHAPASSFVFSSSSSSPSSSSSASHLRLSAAAAPDARSHLRPLPRPVVEAVSSTSSSFSSSSSSSSSWSSSSSSSSVVARLQALEEQERALQNEMQLLRMAMHSDQEAVQHHHDNHNTSNHNTNTSNHNTNNSSSSSNNQNSNNNSSSSSSHHQPPPSDAGQCDALLPQYGSSSTSVQQQQQQRYHDVSNDAHCVSSVSSLSLLAQLPPFSPHQLFSLPLPFISGPSFSSPFSLPSGPCNDAFCHQAVLSDSIFSSSSSSSPDINSNVIIIDTTDNNAPRGIGKAYIDRDGVDDAAAALTLVMEDDDAPSRRGEPAGQRTISSAREGKEINAIDIASFGTSAAGGNGEDDGDNDDSGCRSALVSSARQARRSAFLGFAGGVAGGIAGNIVGRVTAGSGQESNDIALPAGGSGLDAGLMGDFRAPPGALRPFLREKRMESCDAANLRQSVDMEVEEEDCDDDDKDRDDTNTNNSCSSSSSKNTSAATGVALSSLLPLLPQATAAVLAGQEQRAAFSAAAVDLQCGTQGQGYNGQLKVSPVSAAGSAGLPRLTAPAPRRQGLVRGEKDKDKDAEADDDEEKENRCRSPMRVSPPIWTRLALQSAASAINSAAGGSNPPEAVFSGSRFMEECKPPFCSSAAEQQQQSLPPCMMSATSAGTRAEEEAASVGMMTSSSVGSRSASLSPREQLRAGRGGGGGGGARHRSISPAILPSSSASASAAAKRRSPLKAGVARKAQVRAVSALKKNALKNPDVFLEALIEDECALYAGTLKAFFLHAERRGSDRQGLSDPVASVLSQGDDMHFLPVREDPACARPALEGSAFVCYIPT